MGHHRLTHFTQIEPGDIISLYNYYCGYDEYTRQAPRIVGVLIRIGWEAQFEFYELAVIKDERGKGGYTQRYLTSDFFATVVSNARKENENGEKKKER